MLFMANSCTDLFSPGNEKTGGSKGMVTICLSGDGLPAEDAFTPAALNSGENMAVFNTPKTFLPQFTSNLVYTFKFTSASDSTVVRLFTPTVSGTGSTRTAQISLETGTWKVDVTLSEQIGSTSYILGVSDTAPQITVPGNSPDPVPVTLKRAQGTGYFGYTITCSQSGTQASMHVTPVLVGGAPISVPLTNIPDGGLTGILALPAGDYDVTVTLNDQNGNYITGKYSAACIYPGLETNTTAGYFAFTADNFVKSLNIMGSLTLTNDAGITFVQPITVIASSVQAPVPVGTPTYTSTSLANGDWLINITDPLCRSVYLSVKATGTDINGSQTYVYNNYKYIDSIPVTGINTGIDLSPQIYSIGKDPSWPTENEITIKVNGNARNAAFPGETVSLNVTSDYGLKTGTLMANNTAVTGSANPYSFNMPVGNVILKVSPTSFFNAALSGLVITTYDAQGSINGTISKAPTDFDSNDKCTLKVPSDASAISIKPTLEENGDDVQVAIGEVSIDIDEPYDVSPGDNITVTVTPPVSGGGNGSSRTYKLTVNVAGP